MTQRLGRLMQSRFARFVLVGGCAAAVNLLSRYFLSEVMPFRWAVIAAYLFGMVTAWVLSRFFVFEPSGRHWSKELLRFGIVNVFAAAQVWIVSVGLAEWLFPHIGYGFHPQETAHLIGVILPVFTSFFGHRHFSFAKK